MPPEESGKLTWGDLKVLKWAPEREWVVPSIGDTIETYPEFHAGSGTVADLIPDPTMTSGLRVVTDRYPSGFCCSWVAKVIK